jgi:uncharacterized protein YsxB (DUF464 family)
MNETLFRRIVLIRIRVLLNEESIDRVELTGHGGRTRGRDIVCAAVSAVAETALAGVLHYAGNLVEWEMREGYLAIALKKGDMESNTKQEGMAGDSLPVILNTMLIGLREIARQYPGKVRIDLEHNPGVSNKV